MQLLGADRHLRAKAELAAVGEARGGVHVDGGRVHFIDKAVGVTQGAGQDGVGVLGAMFPNMGDSLIHIGHHFDVQIQRQILVVILLRFHRLDFRRAVLQRGEGGRGGMQGDAALGHLLAQRRQEGVGDVAVHQQRFHGIAGARPLGLGIDDDLQRRGDLGGFINENMAHANPAGDHRDR